MRCYFWFTAWVLYLPLALKDNTCFFKREREECGYTFSIKKSKTDTV